MSWNMDRTTVIRLLYKHGWLHAFASAEHALGRVSDAHLPRVVRDYQRFHGLIEDGWAGPQTYQSMHQPRMCGLPDYMALGETLPKWPQATITWTVTAAVPGLTLDETKDAFCWAWGQWAGVCAVQPEYTANAKTAMVVSSVGPIDGPGGVLAFSELPDGTMNQRHQTIDEAEAWTFADDPSRLHEDLGRVLVHELGHVAGCGHLPVGNIMQPLYDPKLRVPQAGDITEMQARYGPHPPA